MGAAPRLCNLVANHSAAAAVAEILGLGDALAEFPDEATCLRDALWYCDMATSTTGSVTTFQERIADIRARHGRDATVRALDAGGLEARAAAFQRTERKLARSVVMPTAPRADCSGAADPVSPAR